MEVELQLLEAKSELDRMKESHTDILNRLRQQELEVKKLQEARVRALKEAKQIGADVQRANLSAEEIEIRNEFLRREDRSIEVLDNEVQSTKTRISLMSNLDPTIIQEYEDRQEKIRQVTDKLESLQNGFQELADEIEQIKGQWKPQLIDLVKEINNAFGDNFAKINCVGEVSVYEDEDFSQWAIHIRVRFRENEQLSILDSHRQSGGERAVSTIFYLMSLQSLAKSPFRVVDEINQGMDPRNERMVHERMVGVACAENTSQYFLITPKLLTGLKYHRRMMVHTIYSGATMPQDNTKLDLRGLADLAMRVRAK
jgi:structural maintenance of chromosomes protein 5